jgi:hypothetical protein
MSQDPLNILSNPPSTIVKIHGTSRDDINGQLGIAVQFIRDRSRYLIHLVNNQTTIAIKPDNIVKASTMETYQAHYSQIKNDPKLRRELSKYYRMVHNKLGVKPEYAAAFLSLLFLGMIYCIGFSRAIMILSMILLVGIILGPDLVNDTPASQLIQNFPRRCREAMEQSLPILRGRITDTMAAGAILLILVFSLRAITYTPKAAMVPRNLDPLIEDGPPKDWSTEYPTTSQHVPIAKSKTSFGFTQAMSGYIIYQTVKQLGDDGTGFSLDRAIANARQMDLFRMGLLAFSVYNFCKPFLG